MRVGIVDDAAVSRTLLARTIEALGHRVAWMVPDLEAALSVLADGAPATNGADGVPAANGIDGTPDLIVVDGRLPGGGATAIAALRAATPRAALCAVCSLDENGLIRNLRAAGAGHALLRPYLPSHVAALLASLAPADGAAVDGAADAAIPVDKSVDAPVNVPRDMPPATSADVPRDAP